MDSVPANDAAKPDVGLPPVQPPSGRFIAQLFVIPGLIIFVVVLLFIGSTMLVKHEREPSHFLAQLDSDNPDIRWRGLSDLAQILKRNEPAALRWKADPKFALDLTERLDSAFAKILEDEKKIAAEIAQSSDKDRDLAWRKLRDQRNYLGFLASALGEFHMPVGAPVLCTIARYDASADLKGITLQRRKALWALMNMGESARTFAKLPAERQAAVLTSLREEAAQDNTRRAVWARTALHYLDPSSNFDSVVRVDETLVACAEASDPFLRELTAMAFTFWDGPRAEATLLKLANDTGRGKLIRVEEND